MWLNLNCVISVLDGAVLDWIPLLLGRLWLVTHVHHYRKLFKTYGGGARENSGDGNEVVMGGYAGSAITEGGSG